MSSTPNPDPNPDLYGVPPAPSWGFMDMARDGRRFALEAAYGALIGADDQGHNHQERLDRQVAAAVAFPDLELADSYSRALALIVVAVSDPEVARARVRDALHRWAPLLSSAATEDAVTVIVDALAGIVTDPAGDSDTEGFTPVEYDGPDFDPDTFSTDQQ